MPLFEIRRDVIWPVIAPRQGRVTNVKTSSLFAG
jgi:hypothetical protein